MRRRSEVAKSTNVDGGTAIELRRFNTAAYKCIDIWARMDHFQDVQHAFNDVGQAHAAELEASFYPHGIY